MSKYNVCMAMCLCVYMSILCLCVYTLYVYMSIKYYDYLSFCPEEYANPVRSFQCKQNTQEISSSSFQCQQNFNTIFNFKYQRK